MQFDELQVVNRVRSLATNDEPQAQGFLVSFPFQNILAWSVVPQVESFFFCYLLYAEKQKELYLPLYKFMTHFSDYVHKVCALMSFIRTFHGPLDLGHRRAQGCALQKESSLCPPLLLRQCMGQTVPPPFCSD